MDRPLTDDISRVLADMERRIDAMQRDQSEASSQCRTDLAVLKSEVRHVQEVLPNLVSKTEHEPVKKVVYGLVTLVLSGVVVALVGLVVNNGA